MFLYMNLFYRLIGHDKLKLTSIYDIGVADERSL